MSAYESEETDSVLSREKMTYVGHGNVREAGRVIVSAVCSLDGSPGHEEEGEDTWDIVSYTC